jgi:hypothetical protein
MTSTSEGPIPFSSTATAAAEVYTGSTKIVRFDVTADVKKFLAGTPNHGWIIKGRDTFDSAKWIIFGSSESAAPPKLLLNVGPACSMPAPAMDENGHLRNLTCGNSDNGKSSCELRIQARANSDRQNAARLYVSKGYSPAEHLALTRDRSRKVLALASDATRRQQVCDGDDDQDLVPNAADQCPNTRPLRPTDDKGCEQTALPAAPPRGAIDAILGGMGVVYDPRCNGARTPSIPAMNSRFTGLSNGSSGKHLLLFPWNNNQPANCELEFQIMVTTVWADGSSHFSTITFPWPSSDGSILVTSNGLMFEIDPAKGGDQVQWGPNVRAAGVSARVVNGNGQSSSWSATRWFNLPPHAGG